MAPVLNACFAGLPLLEEGGAFDPLKLDSQFWALTFWAAVVFFLLLVVLTKFAWKPLMATVDARENQIKNDLETAETARREAEEARAEHQRQVDESAQKAKEALDDARARAEKLQQELKAEARAEADALVAKARQQINAEKRQALEEIREQVVELSVEISKRIAAKSVDREDHLKEAEGLLQKLNDVV